MKRLLMLLVTAVAAGQSLHAEEIYTTNFAVRSSDVAFAQKLGERAETLRAELSEEWLGSPLPDWKEPCVVQVNWAKGNWGDNSYTLLRGQIRGMVVDLYGDEDQILAIILPHEVCHLVLATHFGLALPLPRWADEGIALLIEGEASKNWLYEKAEHLVRDNNYFPTRQLFEIKEYPTDDKERLKFYLQSHSLVSFLYERGGAEPIIQYLEAGCSIQALEASFDFSSLEELHSGWLEWMENRIILAAQ